MIVIFSNGKLKHLRETLALICLSILMFAKASAQRFGGNPPSLKWEQINSDTVRVVFPKGLEATATDVADIIHQVNRISGKTIGGAVRKVNIVLQNQTVSSNGYVALGPFRSEFFLTPRQNSFELGSLPWHKTLALHEYRHVQQFNNFRTGLSKIAYYVFGELGLALANSAAVPDWFFEGDAVYQETLLSGQGRGRIPYFLNPYKAIWAAGKHYSWMKLRNGSYRDLIPDHYDLGYMLVDYGREKYGDTIWKNVAGDAARYKGLFYPLQRAIKRHTGEDYKQFRQKALQYFSKKLVDGKDSSGRYAEEHKHFVANESFPQWLDSTHLVYVKTSYDQPASFVIRDLRNNQEQTIRKKDISSDTYFSLRHGTIVYCAYNVDPRWQWRDYSEIRLLDVKSGKQRTITKKTKYLSADLSIDGNTLVAVKSDPSGVSRLHLIDVHSGKLTKELANETGLIYTYPKFLNADQIVSAIRNNKGEMALAIVTISTNSYRLLVPFSGDVIAFPSVANGKIAFSMTRNGKDRIFIWDRDQLYQVNPGWDDGSAGLYQLSIINDQFAWTAFTAVGYHIATGTPQLVPISPATDLEKVSSDLVNNLPARDFDVQPYSKSFGLFNFHSWRPYISDPEYSYIVSGENILNTFRSDLYFTYNRNENFKETGAAFSYAGWFPVLSLSGAYTFDRSFADSAGTMNWNELNGSLGARIPLTFVKGIYTRTLSISTALVRKQLFFTGPSKQRFDNKEFNSSDLSLSFTNQQVKALKNIYPRFAQSVSIRYRSILNRYTARQLGINASLYFPGLFTNHSLVLQGAYQSRDTLHQYNFSNTFPFSRGYSEINFPRMWKLAANYHFPVAYPDAGFGNIVYLLRVRANAFYDFTRIKSLQFNRSYELSTAGVELYLDSKWWNQVPVTFGFRFSRLLDNTLTGQRPNQFEFILPVNIL